MTVDLHAAFADLLAATVDAVRLYDERNGTGREEIGLRVGDVVAEAGETMDAWIGVTGHNPRKGVWCGPDKVAAEAGDTIAAALKLLSTLADVYGVDPASVIVAVARKVRERAAEGLGRQDRGSVEGSDFSHA